MKCDFSLAQLKIKLLPENVGFACVQKAQGMMESCGPNPQSACQAQQNSTAEPVLDSERRYGQSSRVAVILLVLLMEIPSHCGRDKGQVLPRDCSTLPIFHSRHALGWLLLPGHQSPLGVGTAHWSRDKWERNHKMT